MLGRADPPLPTGDLAYRIVLNKEDIQDPEMLKMMTEPAFRLYAGPKAHAIMYSLKGGSQMNIVLLTPDDLPPEARRESANTEEMMELFNGWDPILRKFLGLVKGVEKWRLNHRR
jgi:salicylate hydroxylase